jgi:FolB domain-containing protein
MIIRIKNLRLRTIIGLNDWERKKEQDILINLKIRVDDETAVASDDLADGVDYKRIKYRIVEEVEKTSFYLIERLAGFILDIVFENDKVTKATVEIDKPHALRFAESVSLELTRERA